MKTALSEYVKAKSHMSSDLSVYIDANLIRKRSDLRVNTALKKDQISVVLRQKKSVTKPWTITIISKWLSY